MLKKSFIYDIQGSEVVLPNIKVTALTTEMLLELAWFTVLAFALLTLFCLTS